MTPLIISGHHTGTRQQHFKHNEAGATVATPAFGQTRSSDQCPAALMVSAATASIPRFYRRKNGTLQDEDTTAYKSVGQPLHIGTPASKTLSTLP